MDYMDPAHPVYPPHRHENMSDGEMARRLQDPWWFVETDADSDRARTGVIPERRLSMTDSDDGTRTDFGLKRALAKVAGGPTTLTLIGDRTAKDEIYLDDINTRIENMKSDIENAAVEEARARELYDEADSKHEIKNYDKVNHDWFKAQLILSYAQKEYNIFVGELNDLHEMPPRSRDDLNNHFSTSKNIGFMQRSEQLEWFIERHNPNEEISEVARLIIELKKTERIAQDRYEAFKHSKEEAEKLKVALSFSNCELAKRTTLLYVDIQNAVGHNKDMGKAYKQLSEKYNQLEQDHVKLQQGAAKLVAKFKTEMEEHKAEKIQHNVLRLYVIGYHANSNPNYERDLAAVDHELSALGYNTSHLPRRVSQPIQERPRKRVVSRDAHADESDSAPSLADRNVPFSHGGTDSNNGFQGNKIPYYHVHVSKANQVPGQGFIDPNQGELLPATRYDITHPVVIRNPTTIPVAHAAAYGKGEDELCNDFCCTPSSNASDTSEGGVAVANTDCGVPVTNTDDEREGSITPKAIDKRHSASNMLNKVASMIELRPSKSVRSIRVVKQAAKRVYSDLVHDHPAEKQITEVAAGNVKDLEVCKWHEPGGKFCEKVGKGGKVANEIGGASGVVGEKA